MARPTPTIQLARNMRHKPTDAEQRLWLLPRDRRLNNYKFRRQHPVGPYIADFVCISHTLIIEADGSQHADNIADAKRTADLEKWGWDVLRFWNTDILQNPQGVLESIVLTLQQPRPLTHPSPPHGGEGISCVTQGVP